MKTIRLALILGFAAAVTAISTAWGADSEAVKKDKAQLEGEWSMVSGSADGYAMPDAILRQCRRVCKGEEIVVTVGTQLMMKARITIDPSRKPKTIDYEIIDGPNKGNRHLGIYEPDGDTFKSCFGAPGADRPADFTSVPGDHRTASEWKRKKKQAPEFK